MSSDYSVFAKGDPEALLAEVQHLLGCTFGEANLKFGGARHAEILGVPVTYQAKHGLEDDMGIPFESFPASVEFARSAAQHDPELRDTLCRVLAILCARHLSRLGTYEIMVVRNLQERLEVW